MQRSTAELEQAKNLLRDNGYVVIPRERHVVLTVHKSFGWREHECLSKDAEGWKRFNKYIDNAVAREIGYAMFDKGAITKTDLGWKDGYSRITTEYQAGIILPKA